MSVDMTRSNVVVEASGEHIWITVSKYALFMSYGKRGIDAMVLYLHYQFTSRVQSTNKVWAADKYCRQGLEWGRDRMDGAKSLLIELGLVSYLQLKTKEGRFGKVIVVVKTKTLPMEPSEFDINDGEIDRLPVFQQADFPASVKQTTNALTNNINALTNKENALTKDKTNSDADASGGEAATQSIKQSSKSFILKFNELHMKKYGRIYDVSWAKDSKLITGKIEMHGYDTLIELLEAFFEVDEWFNTTRTIGIFCSHINHLYPLVEKVKAHKDYLKRLQEKQ